LGQILKNCLIVDHLNMKVHRGENMETRKVAVLMVLVTALLLSLASVVRVQAAVESVWDYDGDYDNEIEVSVRATDIARPGDEITVEIDGEAKEDLADVLMDIWVEGSYEEGTERWESDTEEVLSEDLDDGDDFGEEYAFEIPETADPGMIVGHVRCEWEVELEFEVDTEVYYEWVTHSFDVAFPMTYLLGVTEEEFKALQEDYAELQAVYTELVSERDKWKTDYTSLKSDYDSLTATYDGLKSSYDSLKSERDTLVSEKDALQKEYNSLDSEHKTFLDEYDALKSEREATTIELSNYTTYTYALAITTIIFVVTTLIFAVRKPSR